MRTVLLGMALSAALALAPGAYAGQADELRATYQRFVTAQNDRDLASVRELLLDTPEFLWVSNGQSFWGRETMLARMARYQRSEVWQAVPDLDHARFVDVSPSSGFIHMPLRLRVGSQADGVAETDFLVSILFVKPADAWRIAALFTTIQNPD